MLTLDVEVKVGNKRKIEGKCKSTDTKPTDIINGSLLIEIDTSKLYFFDEASNVWREWV